jgi:hypothetical protein
MRQPPAGETSLGRESGGKLGDLASIPKGWPISNLNATHLQLHLAITKMIPATDLVKH